MRISCPSDGVAGRVLSLLLVLTLLLPAPSVLSTVLAGTGPASDDPPGYITREDLKKHEDPKKEDEKKLSAKRMGFGFKTGNSYYQNGLPPTTDTADHGHAKLSQSEIASRQKAVADFLQSRQGPLTKNDVVEIYRLAGDFPVIHGMLGNVITLAQSKQIGRLRQQIQNETINLMAKKLKTRGEGKLGINDFGSGADQSKVNAKTDIDFTLYAQNAGISGAELVALYKQTFGEVTAKYGASIDPAIMDIVAHRFEATIPDWRQVQSLSDFEVKLRRGSELLRSNPEAYFLEGAYAQQIMGRSVDPEAKTFTWYDVDADGDVVPEPVNAGEVRQFFYTPEAAARYAFGGSVGNWHFFNAHPADLAAQAKYVLRSMDDGRGLLLSRGMKVSDYADIPVTQRQALIDRMYTNLSPEMRRQVRALLDTCVNIRQLKSKGGDLASVEGLRRAYAPLIDLDRSLTLDNKKKTSPLSDEALTRLAQKRFQRTAKAVLVDNIVSSSTARLTDWLAPQVKPKLRYWQGEMIDMDPQRQQRLQFAAFFELRDALSVMDADTISKIKQENPRFRRDVEILEGVIKKQRELMLAPDNVPESETTKWRREQIPDIESLYSLLRERLMNQLPDGLKGQVEQRLKQFNAAWAQGQEFEDWLQTGMFDAVLTRTGNEGAAKTLMHLRESAAATNERFISPVWMARVAKANSLINILTAYHQQGEVNKEVLKTAAWEFFTYVPVLGLGMDIYAGKGTAAWNLMLVRVLPGYAVVMLYINTMKGIATLAGTVTFAPLERDKLMLAYQGYLDPQDRGLVLGGLKNRQEGPRPGLMHWVDPRMELSLEERRKRFYEFFSPRVLEVTNREVPDGADPIFRDEWRDTYGRELLAAIDRYLDEWRTGTGEWAGFDSLALDRAFDEYLWEKESSGPNKGKYKQQFPNKLKSMLIDDFMKGQELAAARRVAEREGAMASLLRDMSGLAGRSKLLDREFDAVREDCKTAGHIAIAMAADDMPETPASMRIIVAPRVEEKNVGQDAASGSSTTPGTTTSDATKGRLVTESVQLSAKVVASEKVHPLPWIVQWKVSHGGKEKSLATAQTREEIPGEGGGAVVVTARALDADGKTIAETSVNLAIEKYSIADEPGYIGASSFDDDDDKEEDDKTVDGDAPGAKFLLWIEERGTWCWFRSGSEQDFAKVRAEGIWTQQMGGPYNSTADLDHGTRSYKSRAKVLDIPGHGRKHYVEVAGRICFLGVAGPPGNEGGGDAGADDDDTEPWEWMLQVTVIDAEGTPVTGAEVKLADSQSKARETGGGRYVIGPLTINRKAVRAPLTVIATTDKMAGGVQRMEHSRSKRFYPQQSGSTSVTIQLDFVIEDREDPGGDGGGGGGGALPPDPPDPIVPDPSEEIWKFDLNKPFEIKAIAPAKKKSNCLAGAEVLDEQRIQVTVEQEGRQEALIGARAMEALKTKQCVQRDAERCGWIFTGKCGYGSDYTQGPPDDAPMSRHDCIIKYCPLCEGSMLFDEAPDGTPCDTCIKQHSDEIGRCCGGS